MEQMIGETIDRLESSRGSMGRADPRRAVRILQRVLLRIEREGFRHYDTLVDKVDGQLADLEGREDAEARARKGIA